MIRRTQSPPAFAGLPPRVRHVRRVAAVAWILFASATGAVVPRWQAAGTEPPPEHAAYVDLVRADAARDDGHWGQALRLYESARERFEALAREHPEVMPQAVARRLVYCREEIDAVRARLAAGAAEASVEALREIEQLRARIAELEAELTAAEERERELRQRIEGPPPEPAPEAGMQETPAGSGDGTP